MYQWSIGAAIFYILTGKPLNSYESIAGQEFGASESIETFPITEYFMKEFYYKARRVINETQQFPFEHKVFQSISEYEKKHSKEKNIDEDSTLDYSENITLDFFYYAVNIGDNVLNNCVPLAVLCKKFMDIYGLIQGLLELDPRKRDYIDNKLVGFSKILGD